MKVTVERNAGDIICALPDGKEIEIVMVSLSGNVVEQENDLNRAAHLVGQSLNLIEVNTGLYRLNKITQPGEA